jgi:hypothetical protein
MNGFKNPIGDFPAAILASLIIATIPPNTGQAQLVPALNILYYKLKIKLEEYSKENLPATEGYVTPLLMTT